MDRVESFHRGWMRVRPALAVLIAVAATGTAHAELIIHNSFASCWTQAVTKPAFLGLVQSSIEGTTGCVPPQSGTSPFPYTVCNTAGCPGGAIGCTVTLHAGAATGNFTTGAITAPGSADNLNVPITYSIGPPQNCTMSLSSIVINYALSYAVRPDGNSGSYFASLSPPGVTISSYTTGGNCPPAFASLAAAAAAQAQTAASNAIATELNNDTVGESVCPLTP